MSYIWLILCFFLFPLKAAIGGLALDEAIRLNAGDDVLRQGEKVSIWRHIQFRHQLSNQAKSYPSLCRKLYLCCDATCFICKVVMLLVSPHLFMRYKKLSLSRHEWSDFIG